jgi:hypothetical protein
MTPTTLASKAHLINIETLMRGVRYPAPPDLRDFQPDACRVHTRLSVGARRSMRNGHRGSPSDEPLADRRQADAQDGGAEFELVLIRHLASCDKHYGIMMFVASDHAEERNGKPYQCGMIANRKSGEDGWHLERHRHYSLRGFRMDGFLNFSE